MTSTPDTSQIHDVYVYGAWEKALNGCDDEANSAEFNRWLLKVKSQVWEEAEAAFNSALPYERVANPYSRALKKQKTKERKARKNAVKCPPTCHCLCHDGLGDVEHPGSPCYGKG